MTQAAFSLRGRNPDVLSCIANLSNDEVFTPPEFANRMLDTLAEAWAADNDGASIWADPSVTFLDPCTKSGVFLREITKRLIDGLEPQMPDLQARVDHILTRQVFGISITELTAMLARRSLYCSKHANGPHSITRSFNSEAGNVWFERVEHTWDDKKCIYCGASRSTLDRGDSRESYAYAFIHADDIQERMSKLFGGEMQFDVIIGNPPYQMKDGAGGSSASSIYHIFVEQAKKLEPKYLSMIVPSRWLVGGRGMHDFRDSMLGSNNILELVDFPVSKEVFPTVEVKGGICYFLWSRDSVKNTKVTIVRGEDKQVAIRKLNEFDVFIRDPASVSILRKVLSDKGGSIVEILTADTPFGIATNFSKFSQNPIEKYLKLYYVKGGKRSVGFIDRDIITKNRDLIDKWKVFVPKAGSDGGQKIPDSVLGKPWLSAPGAVCTQTFLAFFVDTEDEAKSVQSYYSTKFFRHLVSLRKITQDALRPMYEWVPMQPWDRIWTDEELYKKYRLTDEEIAFVEKIVRPMDLDLFDNLADD
jgi:site-specific DNA-methyltransferase (adenine-specific)